jgi:hypothetical protein
MHPDQTARLQGCKRDDPALGPWPPYGNYRHEKNLYSEMYGWPGIDVHLTWQSERTGIEQKWFALTGRVVDAKVEADGDIHIALVDANGNNVRTVSAEIPVGPKWCEIRQTVFSWTTQKFPFNVKTAHTLKISEPHVITVTGKAFYDIAHAPADHSNRRRTPKDYAV